MKKLKYFVCGVGLLVLLVCTAFAQEHEKTVAVLSVRGFDATRFQEKDSQFCADCDVIQSKTVEFPNGNTYVRILSPIAGKTVYLVIPPRLSADTFIEALIKIRTVKSLGASQVRVKILGKKEETQVLDPKKNAYQFDYDLMFSVAGAHIIEYSDVPSVQADSLVYHHHLEMKQEKVNSPKVWSIQAGHHPQLAYEISQKLGVPIENTGNVSNSSSSSNSNSNSNSNSILLFGAPLIPVNDSLLESLEQISFLTSKGKDVHWVSPYLPYARSDKADVSGVSTVGRLLADMIEAMGAKTVTIVRAHAPQSVGFFSIPCFQSYSFDTIQAEAKSLNIDLVVAPDAGAQKDATKFADQIGVPVAVVNKQREGTEIRSRGISLPSEIDSIVGKRVLIIDDETLTGSTLQEAGAYLKAQGAAYVAAVVTHLTGSGQKVLDGTSIDQMIVTDSIPIHPNTLKHPKLKVLSLSDELAKKIGSDLDITK